MENKIEEVLKEFDEKWERILKSGIRKCINGNYSWEVCDDEDSSMYLDDTIKSFIRQSLQEQEERFRGMLPEPMEIQNDPADGYRTGWNELRLDLLSRLG